MQLLEELMLEIKLPMTVYCNNRATIYIASNQVYQAYRIGLPSSL